MSIYERGIIGEYWDEEMMIGSTKAIQIRKDPTKHYPNKNEAKLLRRLMAESGLTEEVVRSHKKYRVMLSEAQKEGNKRVNSRNVKWFKNKIKEACQKTGLVPQHPDTIKVLDEILENHYNHSWCRPWFVHDKPNAIAVVKNYAK